MKTIAEMIKKYHISEEIVVMPDGQEALRIRGSKKLTPVQVAEVRGAKTEIIAELRRREAERKAIRAERDAAERAQTDAIRASQKPLEMYFHDGEYLSGYMACGFSAQALLRLGLAREISGWGTKVDEKIVDALGVEFTLAQAEEFAAPQLAAKQAKAAAAATAEQAKFDEAAASRKPVLLRKYSTSCDGSACECSLDIVSEWAQPDGSVCVCRAHTH